jgi:chromosome segregation ATPase
MLQIEERIKVIKNKIDRAKNERIRAITKLEGLEKEEKEILEQLKELGVEPEQLADEIARLEKEIAEELSNIEQLLPQELLTDGREIG